MEAVRSTVRTPTGTYRERRAAYLSTYYTEQYNHFITVKPAMSYSYDRLRECGRHLLKGLNHVMYGSRWRNRAPADRLPALIVIEDVERSSGHLHALIRLPDEDQDVFVEKIGAFLHAPASNRTRIIPPSSDIKFQLLRDEVATAFYTSKRFHEDPDWRCLYSSTEHYKDLGR